jgi:hypothetical protein
MAERIRNRFFIISERRAFLSLTRFLIAIRTKRVSEPTMGYGGVTAKELRFIKGLLDPRECQQGICVDLSRKG